MTIELYGLNNCDTCRKARKWLDRQAIDYRFIDYREQPSTPAMLKTWADAVGGFDSLINRSSTTWRNLPPSRKTPGSVAEWNLLIREYPALVKRPVLVMAEDKVQLGFNDKLYAGLFSSKT